MITENLSTLKIHKLTKEQYERELSTGNVDQNALYLTPYEEVVSNVSEVEISDTPPTDENVEIWVNIAEEPIGVAIYGTRAGDSTESIQSDWEQNDETAVDYVKNRPFYVTDPVEVTVIGEQTVTTEDDGDGAYVQLNVDIFFTEGRTYIVNFNGTIYECVAWEHHEGVHIGNGSIIGAETKGNGEPFCILSYPNFSSILDTYTTGTYTFSVNEVQSEVIRIPKKFLINSNIENGEGSGSLKTIEATSASGRNSFAEGIETTASGDNSHAEGSDTIASGDVSHAEGIGTTASGEGSHAEGIRTIAQSYCQHVQGIYNIEDSDEKYLHIVGNGTSNSKRSNAHTLDWDGNAWYAGTVEGTAMIIKSSTSGSTKRFKITVDDSGTISAVEI